MPETGNGVSVDAAQIHENLFAVRNLLDVPFWLLHETMARVDMRSLCFVFC